MWKFAFDAMKMKFRVLSVNLSVNKELYEGMVVPKVTYGWKLRV